MPYWRSSPTYGPAAHQKGLNILYVDGHVKWLGFGETKNAPASGDDYWVVHSWEGYYPDSAAKR